MNLVKKIYNHGINESLYLFSIKINDYLQRRRSFAKKYEFDNRQNKYLNLLLIVAGFQPAYWDEVFSRVDLGKKEFSEGLDICICVPEGLTEYREILKRKAQSLGWSFLYIPKDLLSQAQNTAIKLHPMARWIYKIDEDILISSHYFSRLKKAYIKADNTTFYKVGFIGPLININGYCTPIFLKSIDSYEEYVNKFGEYKIDGLNDFETNLIHKDPNVATFIWSKSIPFDEVSSNVYIRNEGKYSICPVRFSIGAILFSRSYWERIGTFKVGRIGSMGVEEEQVCAYGINTFYPIYVAEDVLVGHLGFYTQKKACEEFYLKNYEQIRQRRIVETI